MNKAFVIFVLTPLVLSSVAWFLTRLYVFICSPKTLMGFFLMPVHLGSPVCHTLSTLQYEIGVHYISLWASSGAAFMLLLKGSENKEKPKVKAKPKTSRVDDDNFDSLFGF